MNKTQRIALFLAAWVVLLPATQGQAQQRPTRSGESRPALQPTFHVEGAEHLMRGRNGFEISTSLGHWHLSDDAASGGLLKATAPWAEELSVRYFTEDNGLMAEISDRISTFTRIDDAGNPIELVVRVDEHEVVVDLMEQSRRMAGGGPAIEPWELEAYELLIAALLEEHDASFWKSIADIHAAAPAGFGCVGETAKCILAIIGWLGSLSGLVAICGATVPSGGLLAPGCLAAIIIHPTVTTGAALACADMLECLEEDDPHGGCGI